MANETDRAAFLAHIEAHFDDRAPRLIYADWLDEQGEAEEATRQRQWHDSKDWLVAFCREWNFFTCNGGSDYDWNQDDTDGDPLIIPIEPGSDEEVIKRLLTEVSSASDWKGLTAIDNELHSAGEIGADLPLFWQHLEVLTGRVFEQAERDDFYWSCSC